MNITMILGTESLGVRGLSCEVQVEDRKVVIDPGVALGYWRHGLLPHPSQVAVGEQSRGKIVLAGLPLYLARLSPRQRRLAWENGLRLAREVDTLILDHHLLRDEAGLRWRDQLASAAGRRVFYAADFMDHPRCLLEARRVQSYKEMPV